MGPDNYWFGARPQIVPDLRRPGVDAMIGNIGAAVASKSRAARQLLGGEEPVCLPRRMGRAHQRRRATPPDAYAATAGIALAPSQSTRARGPPTPVAARSGGRRYSASRSTLHGDVLALARGGAAIGRQARTTRVRTGHTHAVSSAPRWWGRGHLRGRRGSTLLQAGELCLVQLSGRIRRRFRAMGHPAMRRVVGARVSVRRGRRRGCV